MNQITRRRNGIKVFLCCVNIGLFVVSGCVSIQLPIQLQMHRDDLRVLTENPRVYVVTFKSPRFDVDTATNFALAGAVAGGGLGGYAGGVIAGTGGSVAGGIIGATVGATGTSAAVNAIDESRVSKDIQSDPRALVRLITYDDPVLQVREQFVDAMKDRFGMSNFVIVDEAIDNESPKKLREKFKDGVVLGFKTDEWTLTIVPLSTDYWIKYHATSMFYLPREDRYIWRERCGFRPRESTATLSELAENLGQGLKDRLQDTGTRCAKQLAGELIEQTSELNRRGRIDP